VIEVKKIFGILFFVAALFSAGCKSPSSPSPIPPPDETKFYTLKVEYIRTEIKQQDQKNKVVGNSINDNDRTIATAQMTKKDDFHFEIQYERIPDNEKNNVYYVYAIDWARWDRVDDGTGVVGNRFILTVVETGFKLELTNLVLNNLPQNPYRTQSSRMAVLRLKRDGTLTNGE
jgi:hypothetical protein